MLSIFVRFLQNRKDLKIAIHGHTDSSGDDAANLLLSKLRAKSVHDFLISSGVLQSALL